MTTSYAQHFSTRQTPQSQPIPGSNQVKNNAGGFCFAVDDWTRLDRFLILGSEGNTYYCTEKQMTVQNAQCVQRCLADSPKRTIDQIVAVSQSGRAPKNDPAIFALAMAAGYNAGKTDSNSVFVRTYALDQLGKVCRIPTHLFSFVQAVKAFRGRGRSLQNALGEWYTQKDLSELVYHMIKYQSRNGWSNRDVLRLARPTVERGSVLQEVLHWVTKGWGNIGEVPHPNKILVPIWAFERAKVATSAKELVKLIREYNLPRECVPTEFLKDPSVWEALLEKMPMTAMIRNLATMTRVGLIAPLSNALNKIVTELLNEEKLRRAKIHPIAVLSALKTYAQGHGERGQNTWTPVQQVVDALDGAFYKAFKNVDPTNKRWLLGVDISGSMTVGHIAGIQGLSPRIAAAAMSLVTANTEPNHYINGFSHEFVPLSISPRQRLDDVVRYMDGLTFGGTDCSLPMRHALANKLSVDVFVVYTDNETWAGNEHPVQSLRKYREKMGIPAKLIVVGFTSTQFSIADPEDTGMLDIVGFDASAPEFMNQFVVG